jgi:hypothetical protein
MSEKLQNKIELVNHLSGEATTMVRNVSALFTGAN